ncbi:MAG: phospho-N-acetylmuramoyl-pentapeptide-transferase [Anaerolineae bacterium]|nr:phospho-N-acetylmuramoyl-pentapeptide-transferase [Anaerolineae bacterium]
MLPWLGQTLTPVYGPFRLLNSYLFLAGLGAALGALATVIILPKFWNYLPRDNGRVFAVDGERAKGKPVSAGTIFIPVLVFICLLVIPFNWQIIGILACLMLAMLEGHIDDLHNNGGLSEYLLGAIDLSISFMAALILSGLQDQVIWLPLIKTPVTVSFWLYIPLATGILWTMINATNCTDGVDGLSASLSILAFIYLGGILYAIVGHADISQYLLVPHYIDGADWALVAFAMVGCLAGYLWHNSLPSSVLMGDAGSRPMGLLLGILVMTSGNPFLIFVVTGVVLLNGATGLVKVALLRFFKISIFKSIRYPLHDHVRHSLSWSNTQVLVRFVLLQAVGTPLLLVFLFKVR